MRGSDHVILPSCKFFSSPQPCIGLGRIPPVFSMLSSDLARARRFLDILPAAEHLPPHLPYILAALAVRVEYMSVQYPSKCIQSHTGGMGLISALTIGMIILGSRAFSLHPSAELNILPRRYQVSGINEIRGVDGGVQVSCVSCRGRTLDGWGER